MKQTRNLVDLTDSITSNLDEFLIDLRPCCLCNLPGGFGKFPVNTETALIDLAAQDPQRLLCRRDNDGSRV